MHDPLHRLYRTKLTLLALILLVVGGGLLFVGNGSLPKFAAHWPIKDIGSSLFTTGLLGVALYYLDARDSEERDTERLRRVLRDAAPEMRDAVVQGFAVQPDDLKRVATPQLLDKLATNALALRLGDEQFASEIYADLRDQAVRAPERWHDVQVKVRLSAAVERSASGAPLFDVIVEWEYTTVPSHPVQRFACVSDRDEFYELVTDVPATLPWLMTSRADLDAADQRFYELLAFSVDGDERPIRRSSRRGGQTYSAAIGQDLVDAGQPVRIRQVYRTVTPQSGHRLYFEAVQPSRQFSLEVDYTDTDISHMSVTELVSSSHRSTVSRMPEQVDARILGIDLPGWLLPKSGFAFVWTLTSEQPAAVAPRRARAKSS